MGLASALYRESDPIPKEMKFNTFAKADRPYQVKGVWTSDTTVKMSRLLNFFPESPWLLPVTHTYLKYMQIYSKTTN